MHKQPSSPFSLLACRPGAESLLTEELRRRHGLHARVFDSGLLQPESRALPGRPLVFERWRLQVARFFPLRPGEAAPSELIDALWQPWIESPSPWAVRLWDPPSEESGGLARLRGIASELTRGGNRLHPGLRKWEREADKLLRNGRGRVLECCCTPEGVLFAWAEAVDAATQFPLPRMRMDPQAPSRSYLKIEEAFFRMGKEPQEGEQVIDLGAAPGGWSYAFARRGCRVTAVDNGPLRIQDACARRIEHLHRDGLSYRPPPLSPPVDWLAGDMLIPPGPAFGLLKYWAGGRRCRHIVLNLKLPQEDPLPALEPILDWLETQPGLQARQLYHDRREITVFGEVR